MRKILALLLALSSTPAFGACGDPVTATGPYGRGARCDSGMVLLGQATNVNFNSAGDTAITINIAASAEWRMFIVAITNTGTTASLTTAQYGLFTASGGGGTALVASGTAMSGLTSNTVNTPTNYIQAAPAVGVRLNITTVYFRITTPQGAAASGNVYIYGNLLP
jgi:hypothetical protein